MPVGTPLRTALFQVSLGGELADALNSDCLELESSSSFNGLLGFDVDCLIDALERTSVQLVGCQRVIHPLLRIRLRQRGILSIDRLSIVNFGPLLQLSGARPLLGTQSSDIARDAIGAVGGIDLVTIGMRSFLLIRSLKSATFNTVVVRSPEEVVVEELVDLCRSAITAYRQLLLCPWLVPGAGCFEVLLSSAIQEYTIATSVPVAVNEKVRQVISSAFRDVFVALCGPMVPGSSGPSEAFEAVQHSCSPSTSLYGWDPLSQSLIDIKDTCTWDSFPCKRSAIVTAFQSTLFHLRVSTAFSA
jgi:hypothetical protein